MSSYYEKFLASGEVKCIDEEIPFEIPSSWEWSRLGDICSYLHRGKSPKYGEHKFLPIIAQKCNQWDKIYTDRCLFSSKDYIEKYKEEQFVQKGDIIINSTGGGTVGRTGYIDSYVFTNFDRFVVDSHVTLVRSIYPIASKYVYYFLISPLIQIGLEDRCSGSTNQIELGTTTITSYLVPIPPIKEQYRIINQFQKVLPLLERYSTNQIAQDKLNAEINIQLKKSILQEAIQGKLVPQIEKDGSAQELLEQIRQEKQRLVKEGTLKKSALTDSVIYKGDDNKYYELIGNSSVCIDERLPFPIPETWAWCKLKNLMEIQTGASFKKEQANTNKEGIRVLRGGNILPNKYVFKDDDVFVSEEFVNPKTILKKNSLITPAVTSLENIGKMAVIEKDYSDVSAGGFVFIIRPYIQDFKHSLLLAYFLQSPFLIEAMQGITKKSGAAFYNLGKERLNELYLPLPPMAEQQRIVDKINEFLSSIGRSLVKTVYVLITKYLLIFHLAGHGCV